MVNTNPVADGGVVYVTTEGYVYALDAASGSVKWKVASPGYMVSSPAVADGLLYLGSTSLHDTDTRTLKVTAYALDTQTGDLKWQQPLSDDRSEDSSNPVVADGLVYFGTGWSDYTCCELRGNGGHLIALDGAKGRVVWQVDTKGDYGSGGLPTTTFAVASGVLYRGVGYAGPDLPEKQLRALDGKTGAELWKNAADVAFPSVTPDGSLFSVLGRELARYDGKNGHELWKYGLDPTKDYLSRPTVVGDTVYVVGNQARDTCFDSPCSTPTNHTDTLYALDLANGQERWRQDVGGGYYGTRDLTPFQQYLCYDVADFSGDTRHWYLKAVNRNDGTFGWQVDLDNTIFGLPVVSGDTMYFATSDGIVSALQLP